MGIKIAERGTYLKKTERGRLLEQRWGRAHLPLLAAREVGRAVGLVTPAHASKNHSSKIYPAAQHPPPRSILLACQRLYKEGKKKIEKKRKEANLIRFNGFDLWRQL